MAGEKGLSYIEKMQQEEAQRSKESQAPTREESGEFLAGKDVKQVFDKPKIVELSDEDVTELVEELEELGVEDMLEVKTLVARKDGLEDKLAEEGLSADRMREVSEELWDVNTMLKDYRAREDLFERQNDLMGSLQAADTRATKIREAARVAKEQALTPAEVEAATLAESTASLEESISADRKREIAKELGPALHQLDTLNQKMEAYARKDAARSASKRLEVLVVKLRADVAKEDASLASIARVDKTPTMLEQTLALYEDDLGKLKNHLQEVTVYIDKLTKQQAA